MWDEPVMRARPWPWLRNAIFGLLTRPAAGYLEQQVDERHIRYVPIHPNRLQAALAPATPPAPDDMSETG